MIVGLWHRQRRLPITATYSLNWTELNTNKSTIEIIERSFWTGLNSVRRTLFIKLHTHSFLSTGNLTNRKRAQRKKSSEKANERSTFPVAHWNDMCNWIVRCTRFECRRPINWILSIVYIWHAPCHLGSLASHSLADISSWLPAGFLFLSFFVSILPSLSFSHFFLLPTTFFLPILCNLNCSPINLLDQHYIAPLHYPQVGLCPPPNEIIFLYFWSIEPFDKCNMNEELIWIYSNCVYGNGDSIGKFHTKTVCLHKSARPVNDKKPANTAKCLAGHLIWLEIFLSF